MRCPNCHVKNSDFSNYCRFCGFELNPEPPVKKSRAPWIWFVFLISLAVIVALQYDRLSPSKKVPEKPVKKTGSVSDITSARPKPEDQRSETQQSIQPPDFFIGIVSLEDISGEVIARLPVPVVSGGWFSLPTEISYGGYTWLFSDEPDKQIEIEWGILHEHDRVGLWWVDGQQGLNSPDLLPWEPREPLYWVSILSNDPPIPVDVKGYSELGFFTRIKRFEKSTEPGIFFQDDKIVGWSFGELSEGGYLWTGRPGKELIYDFRVEDFYRLTFAGTREEAFALALGRKDSTDAERLLNLAGGFRLESKIPEAMVPSHLRAKSILKNIRKLVTELLSQARYQTVADTLDDQILIQAQDPALLADVSYAVMKTYGHENAIWLLETVQLQNAFDKSTKLTRLHLMFYQDWFSEMMEADNLYDAARTIDSARVFFPENPEIHLLSVRLALAQKDWEEAQQLLYSRQYPDFLLDKTKNLDNEISDLKSQEESIVIRFMPHAKHIPVKGKLNESLFQYFIVDTGASMTTIPSATARKLGIRINDKLPVRRIYTAGGIIEAPETILASIEIDGWVIYDLKTLIVDLPRQDGTGLLGLNYLNHFNMTLDSEKGFLSLGPR